MSTKEQILDVYFVVNEDYTIRREEYDGKPHIVVPVTMMVEGVHSGSHGPILHLAEELGRYPESWDGIPVTIGHPQVNGVYVSANSPEVLHDWAVGRIFNTHMNEGKLQAEAWLCEDDLERVSEETLSMINNNEIVEVSVGIFSDEEDETGTWNTERYAAIARNHRPNHLALLPNEEGACSIEDGCGIRVNKKGGTEVTKEQIIVNSENQSQVLKELNRKGFSVNEMGYSELADKIRSAVYSLDGGGLDNYVEEIYPDYVVYRQNDYRSTPNTNKMFKRSYEVDAANNIVLGDEAVQVKKEVSYENVPQVNTNGKVKRRTEIKNNNVMANCTECVKKLVDGLIANKSLAWSENDRETLEAMSEETLEKITPQPVSQPQVNKQELTREDVLRVFKNQPMSLDESLEFLGAETASHIREGLEIRTNQKNKMITEITTNSEVYTKEELELKDLDDVIKIHKLVAKEENQVVYSGGGGLGGKTQVQTNNSGPKTVMLPKGVKVEASK